MGRFCWAPWMTISTDVNGSIRPCCRYEQPERQMVYKMPFMKDMNLNELWNSKDMQNLRAAFLNGMEPVECSWCWSEEQAGIQSFRQKYKLRDFEKPKIDETNPTIAPPPKIYDLKLSNICNLKCRMCGPQASSLIAKEENIDIPYLYSEKIIGTPNEDIFFNEWLPHMEELELTGGEPFFSPENKKLLQKIGKSEYAKNIQVLITTNAMFYDKKTLDALTKFKHVIISLSIDDVGERLAHQRGGANWKKIQENVFKIRENYPKFWLSVYRTVNIFNIWYLNELDEFCMDNNLPITNGMLHEPEEFSIRNLPNFIKEMISEKYSDRNANRDVLAFLMLEDNSPLPTTAMFDKIREKDKIRKEKFAKIYEEWAEVLMYYE